MKAPLILNCFTVLAHALVLRDGLDQSRVLVQKTLNGVWIGRSARIGSILSRHSTRRRRAPLWIPIWSRSRRPWGSWRASHLWMRWRAMRPGRPGRRRRSVGHGSGRSFGSTGWSWGLRDVCRRHNELKLTKNGEPLRNSTVSSSQFGKSLSP